MKTILSFCLSFLLVCGASAQIDEKIKRSFETANSPELSIKNSFGDITIKKHRKKIIEVLVEINVVPRKSRDYEKVKDRVKIQIEESGDRLELTTINELKGIPMEQLEIDYTVSIPENTSLKIRNQFGDVWIEGTESNVYARVQHGDFYCGDIGGKKSSIEVQFGKLRLEEVGDAELEIQHGDFRAYRLRDVEFELQFSDAEIDHLEGDLEIDAQHSDLSIGNIGIGFANLEIDAQFSDIEIDGGLWTGFLIELEGSFTNFSFPSILKERIDYKSDEINSVEYRINTKITDKKIRIDANHSDVDLN